MSLIIDCTQHNDQIINCTMADFVIFTDNSCLLGNFVELFKSFSFDILDHSALISRLMLPFRDLSIFRRRYSNYIIYDAMADFAVYHKFGP